MSPDPLTERLQRLYASAVHDVLRERGHDAVVLPTTIRPLDPSRKLAGPVWTCCGRMDRTKSRHDTLLGWTTLLSKAPAGHVIVCQPNNHAVAASTRARGRRADRRASRPTTRSTRGSSTPSCA
jgi:regulator of RNase E activity RraA